jgi:hypothetical protein
MVRYRFSAEAINFLYSTTSRPALGSIQRVPRGDFQVGKETVPKSKMIEIYPHFPLTSSGLDA